MKPKPTEEENLKQILSNKHKDVLSEIDILDDEKRKLEIAYVKFAKYRVGDRVKANGHGHGVVLYMKAYSKHGEDIQIYYTLKKMKADGTQGKYFLTHYPVPEKDLEPFCLIKKIR